MDELDLLRPGAERIAARVFQQVTWGQIDPRDGFTGRDTEGRVPL